MTDYGFGFSQEDERVEAAFLPAARLLCIASGGEVPLGLAARGATVDAVDTVPGQIHLCLLKRAAALHLEPADAARFLGYAAVGPQQRRNWYRSLSASLPPDTRVFWECREKMVDEGALWAGRFEGYLRRVMRLVTPLWGKAALERLCSATSLEEQERAFDDGIGRPWLRGAFHLVFHPAIYGKRGIDRRALAQRQSPEPLAEQFFRWFRCFCTATPAQDNWFLQVVLLGGLRDPEAGPDFLRPSGVTALRSAEIRFWTADIGDWLAGHDQSFDGFHLSNVVDWMDAPSWENLLRAMRSHAAPKARFLWRELQTARPIPEDLQAFLNVDREAGEAARLRDRFPFYRIVPGHVS